MTNYVELNIKIHLEGDTTGIIEKYNYSLHTNPSYNLKYDKIYIPFKTLITDDYNNYNVFKNYINKKKKSINNKTINNKTIKNYNPEKDVRQIFLTTDGLMKFLSNRPEYFKRKSLEKHNLINNLLTKLETELETVKIKSKEESKKYYKTIDQLEKRIYTEKESIEKNNINLILSLYFKKNTNFYFKNKKYIINNFNIKEKSKNINNNIEIKSYDDLISDFTEMMKNEKYKNKYQQLKQRTTQITQEKINKLKESAKYEAILLINSENINSYGNYIASNLNENAKMHNESIQYEYQDGIGIKFKNDRSLNKNITIILDIRDAKTKYISNIKYNCKTRKKQIIKLIEDITGKTSSLIEKKTKKYKPYNIKITDDLDKLYYIDEYNKYKYKNNKYKNKNNNYINYINYIKKYNSYGNNSYGNNPYNINNFV